MFTVDMDCIFPVASFETYRPDRLVSFWRFVNIQSLFRLEERGPAPQHHRHWQTRRSSRKDCICRPLSGKLMQCLQLLFGFI